MPKKKEEVQVVQEIPAAETTEEKQPLIDLKADLLEVGHKLCRDLMDGKARNEETALTAIVEIYKAVHAH